MGMNWFKGWALWGHTGCLPAHDEGLPESVPGPYTIV